MARPIENKINEGKVLYNASKRESLRKKSGKGIGKGKRVQRENHKGRGKARFFVGFYFSPFPFGC
ncbi:MAG: hypothetical protein IJ251_01220, partial [Oscillospiraceae bacterium]|nr:hypothetical protein [Oscillospiraceae bacterium]